MGSSIKKMDVVEKEEAVIDVKAEADWFVEPLHWLDSSIMRPHSG